MSGLRCGRQTADELGAYPQVIPLKMSGLRCGVKRVIGGRPTSPGHPAQNERAPLRHYHPTVSGASLAGHPAQNERAPLRHVVGDLRRPRHRHPAQNERAPLRHWQEGHPAQNERAPLRLVHRHRSGGEVRVIPLKMSGLRCGGGVVRAVAVADLVIPLKMSGLRCGAPARALPTRTPKSSRSK